MSNGQLIAIVLAVIALELLLLLLLVASARQGRRRALMRQMLPGAASGLFLTLALREVHAGGPLLALWLACAGAAHALDWVQRARQ